MELGEVGDADGELVEAVVEVLTAFPSSCL
jgi:hypothetical protein